MDKDLYRGYGSYPVLVAHRNWDCLTVCLLWFPKHWFCGKTTLLLWLQMMCSKLACPKLWIFCSKLITERGKGCFI